MIKSFIPALLALSILGGCASSSVPWVNPDVPKDQWSKDWSNCRRQAERQAGFREDQQSSAAFREYDRAQMKKQIAGYANYCMIDRGYLPAEQAK